MNPTARVKVPGRISHLVAGSAAAILLFGSFAGVAHGATDKKTAPTFTTIASSANPVFVGVNFTVLGMECDRVADIHPTGVLTFNDITTGASLGRAILTPDPTFENCSDASVADTETLAPGTYTITDLYVPGGSTPVPASASASYPQVVVNPTFTSIRWTAGASVPHAHLEGAVVALKGNVYDISGSTGDCTDGLCGAMQPAVDVYHPSTNSFTAATPIPNPRTSFPAAVVIGGRIYVVGGANNNSPVAPIDVFTPGSGWTTLPAASNLPAGLGGSVSCAAGDGSNIYFFDATTGRVGILNTATSPPSWSVSLPLSGLSPSSFCSAVQVGPNSPTDANSHIILVGAGDGDPDSYSQRVLIYTPATATMTVGQGTTVPTAEQSAAVLEGTLVVAGGDFNLTAVEGIAPGEGSVTAYPPLPDGREDASGGSVVNNKFYIVGGQSDTTTTPAVLVGTPF